jgi:hypothetical protein
MHVVPVLVERSNPYLRRKKKTNTLQQQQPINIIITRKIETIPPPFKITRYHGNVNNIYNITQVKDIYQNKKIRKHKKPKTKKQQ